MATTPSSPPTAQPLSEDELESSMRTNVVAGALGTVWLVGVYGLPLPLFMQAIHATGFQLGLMAANRQAAMLAQIPSAFIVERLHRRKPYWARIATIHRLLWLVPALLPLLWPSGQAHWVAVVIIAVGVSDALGNASTAPWLSWMADLLPAGRAGRFWGRRQRLLSVVVLLAALSFGGILDAANRPPRVLLGFTIVFAISALFGVGDIVVHSAVAEPPPQHGASGQPFWRRLAVPLRDRDFRRMTLAFGACSAALALPGYFYGTPGFFNMVYLHETFGATYSEASWLILASALGAVLWSHPIGHRMDRFGARKVAMGLVTIGPIFTLAWFFASPGKIALPFLWAVPQPVLLMSAASLVIGGFYAGIQICQYRLTQMLTPNAGRTVAMAVHWSTAGLIGSVGALTGGWIKDHMPQSWTTWVLPGGTHFSYFHVLILLQALIAWCVVVPLLASVKDPRQEIP